MVVAAIVAIFAVGGGGAVLVLVSARDVGFCVCTGFRIMIGGICIFCFRCRTNRIDQTCYLLGRRVDDD